MWESHQSVSAMTAMAAGIRELYRGGFSAQLHNDMGSVNLLDSQIQRWDQGVYSKEQTEHEYIKE